MVTEDKFQIAVTAGRDPVEWVGETDLERDTRPAGAPWS